MAGASQGADAVPVAEYYIVHEPAAKPAMSPESRHALLAAIAKARGWIEDLRLGRIATLAEIADREGLGERLLAPLAFVASRIVAASQMAPRQRQFREVRQAWSKYRRVTSPTPVSDPMAPPRPKCSRPWARAG